MNAFEAARIEELKKQIEYEHQEEYRYVEKFRPLVQEVDRLSKSFLGILLNRATIKRLNKEMQSYADVANDHQRRKNQLRKELNELESAIRNRH
ncbi:MULTISPECIES: hypothetical protein [Roseivirga]|jgi:vacuolar-type H+-ATPase subunit I/STV1|uniref:Uncharacterized protein n=1 Tax=Roseivirga thermotolerans TaxID=1758176 RepID=A0ABQ3I9L8_9BACT|nr:MULTISPECIES: hypothetical protein [Roseivirga]MEC7755915.1 hypothetical protein [Bacteroidota bacterium]GHE69524.1 hypothetical protein GCM10011340_26930 [Roseivirga thermotolerans]|tara:strand:- start:2141 stop:2422 length:282 start_codon:yes stop_codon:yes gene_type:complete